jgi:DNA-binding response OmpR family regulator
MESTRTILIAEEDPATRAFLIDNLAADGYRTVAADDRTSALAKLSAHQPDLVVCDVNGDTLDLIDAVRGADGVASRIPADTPLIVLVETLTGHDDRIDQAEALALDYAAEQTAYHVGRRELAPLPRPLVVTPGNVAA